eukprot:2135215-Prymnesium_polylepis.2
MRAHAIPPHALHTQMGPSTALNRRPSSPQFHRTAFSRGSSWGRGLETQPGQIIVRPAHNWRVAAQHLLNARRAAFGVGAKPAVEKGPVGARVDSRPERLSRQEIVVRLERGIVP